MYNFHFEKDYYNMAERQPEIDLGILKNDFENYLDRKYIFDKDIRERRKLNEFEKFAYIDKFNIALEKRKLYFAGFDEGSTLKTGSQAKKTKHKMILSGNIIEHYSYNDYMSYDYKMREVERAENYEGLEGEALENAKRENEKKSANRSRVNFMRLVNANLQHFERFITVTFDSKICDFDTKDIEACNKEFKKFIQRLNSYLERHCGFEKKLRYIAVPEIQNDKKNGYVNPTFNIHYHFLADAPFIQNIYYRMNDYEKTYIDLKIEFLKRKVKNGTAEEWEKKLAKKEKIGILDFLWRWGSVDIKAVKHYEKGQNFGKYMSKYMAKTFIDEYEDLKDLEFECENINEFNKLMKKYLDDYEYWKRRKRCIEHQRKVFQGKRRYLASKGLDKPVVLKDEEEIKRIIKEKDLTEEKVEWSYYLNTDFCSFQYRKYNINGLKERELEKIEEKKLIRKSGEGLFIDYSRDVVMRKVGKDYERVDNIRGVLHFFPVSKQEYIKENILN